MDRKSHPRFNSRQNTNGFWTVYDVFTGQPAIVNDIVLEMLDQVGAAEWVVQLNLEYANRSKGRIH